MLIGLVFFVLLSPVWGYGLYWVFVELLRPDPREGIDWQLVTLGALFVLVGLGIPAVVLFQDNREQAFMSACDSRGLSPEECHWRWYGEKHRH